MADYNSIYTGEEIDAAVGNSKTAADLKTAYESNADTNAFTDAEKNKLSGIETGAEVNAVDSVNGATGVVILTTGDITEDTDANYVTDAQLAVIGNTIGTNTGDQDISGISTNASAISTLDGEVVKKSDYTPAHSILVQQSGTGSPESLSIGTNTLIGRLSGGSSEIDDLSASQVRTLLNVEDGADVTDTTNVTAAGALMDSEVVNLDQVKNFNSADYATAAQGALADSSVQPSDNVSTLTNDAGYIESDPTGVTVADAITNIISLTQAEYDAIATPDAATIYNITDAPPQTGLQAVVDDTTPQLGGSLDTQGNAITGNYSTDGHRTSIIESTSARTLSLTDAGGRILFQNASASTCTIPTNDTAAFPIDTEIDLVDMTDGLLTTVADTGVTLNGVSAGSTSTTAKYAGATLIKIGTDSWLVFGKINDVA